MNEVEISTAVDNVEQSAMAQATRLMDMLEPMMAKLRPEHATQARLALANGMIRAVEAYTKKHRVGARVNLSP